MKTQTRSQTTLGAGYFNKPITIQNYTTTRDAMGGASKNWTDYVKTMAHIEYKTGRERVIGQQVYPLKEVIIAIRYRPSDNIDNSMRIKYKSQIYNIRSVGVLAEARETIEIKAEEQQAKGSL